MYDIVNVTGFMAFGGIDKNPTELVIDALRNKPHRKIRRIQKLDVTVKDVDSYIFYLSKSCSVREGKILNIHLGVGPNEVYFLESCGYNCKDFPIPDNNGYQCTNEPITKSNKLDAPLRTKLSLPSLCQKLLEKGHKSEISTDPGRYICNYIYFLSLEQVKGEHINSLFVHFPELHITTHEQNFQFINDLIDILTEKQ